MSDNDPLRALSQAEALTLLEVVRRRCNSSAVIDSIGEPPYAKWYTQSCERRWDARVLPIPMQRRRLRFKNLTAEAAVEDGF